MIERWLRRLWSPLHPNAFRCKPGDSLPIGRVLRLWHPRTWALYWRIAWIALPTYRGRWFVWFTWCFGGMFHMMIKGDIPRDD